MKGTHSSPDDISWFARVDTRSEMDVDRMHTEYNKVNNYGSKPGMKKFAASFAKMELVRRDKWLRYKNCIANRKPLPHTRKYKSDIINRRVMEVRNEFIDNQINNEDYIRKVSIKYLKDMYEAMYPAKNIEEWNASGRFGLRWL